MAVLWGLSLTFRKRWPGSFPGGDPGWGPCCPGALQGELPSAPDSPAATSQVPSPAHSLVTSEKRGPAHGEQKFGLGQWEAATFALEYKMNQSKS